MTAPAADPFKPEKLTAYEIGVKSDLTRRLRVNAAVFYYRYTDQQILGKVFDDASQSFIGRFVNANSRISGGEVDFEWRPLAALSFPSTPASPRAITPALLVEQRRAAGRLRRPPGKLPQMELRRRCELSVERSATSA